MKEHAYILLFFLLFCTIKGESQVVAERLQEMTILPDGNTWVGQFSSRSPHQLNGDVGHFLYRDDNGDAVIFDVHGPGCVRSMWATIVDTASVLKFYFDGEPVPRYSIRTTDFYMGKHPEFKYPAVSFEPKGYYLLDAKAGNSFVPIPFEKGLRISVEGDPAFYHVLYERYPFNRQYNPQYKKYIDAVFQSSGQRQKEGNYSICHVDSLAPGKSKEVFFESGQGEINSIEINAPADERFLQDIWITMVWDSDNTPGATDMEGKPLWEERRRSALSDVEAPIGFFFGSPYYVRKVTTLPVSVIPDGNGRVKLLSNFVMPYGRNGRIMLSNRSDSLFVGDVECKIGVEKGNNNSEKGYFTTVYRKGMTEYGRDWVFCDEEGTGSFLGVVQSCRLEHYCEGNEHFYIDGNLTPQINGTGTEDYYLACLWPNIEFNTPFAGCVGDVRIQSGGDTDKEFAIFPEDYLLPSVYYRFHMEMPIPFLSKIDARIEHGVANRTYSDYASLAYLYLKRKPVMVVSDFIDIGSKSSRKQHGYKADSGVAVELTASYEGDRHRTLITDKGMCHESGKITFSVAVNEKNRGVRLRRRMDQTNACQRARVYVDGQYVGDWYDPIQNNVLKWRDSEFMLPSEITSGKEKLQIQLVVDGSSAPFTEFEYTVLNIID